MSPARLPWRLLRGVGVVLFAVVLLIEEWGWRPLTAFAARVMRWGPLARLEARIARLPPKAALALFLVPAVALFPLKLAAVWLMQRGHAVLGVVLLVGAKLVGTAFVGRLFIVTEAQVVQIGWFARALAWWRATKERMHDAAQALVRPARVLLRRWWRRVRPQEPGDDA